MNTHGLPCSVVPVYSFRTLDAGWETSPVAPFKATREAIDRVFVGDLLESTLELVPAAELDDQGRWQRQPSGWAGLRLN